MAKLTTTEIKEKAKEIIKSSPGGIRFTNLVRQIHTDSPETPKNTIHGSVWNLDTQFPAEIVKPSRGLYTSSTEEVNGQVVFTTPSNSSLAESEFYTSFAEWIQSDLDEVTIATDLGGAGLQRKWGTPDVVGVYKPLASNLIKFPIEIVSAEIKIDPNASVVAFGQAVAYRLFSAKSYIVMPSTISEEDLSRLEALCLVHGIGLVVFETNPNDPKYEIRVRAQKSNPDMFYVNEFAERLKQFDSEKFEMLFR
ncbi:MAG: hypothetical protein U1E10_05700 [Bdellovibrionales bacterium]|nr:hypothetical protein [Bdellovibrionales bacterium]